MIKPITTFVFKSAKLTAGSSVENICCEMGEYGCLLGIYMILAAYSRIMEGFWTSFCLER
ncbi:hypothetical protein DN53_17965 [Flagellimonas olearia]|uniref:Uncharacterized protein n=1 Tax=Flagellimonas olearia TaxID=552546 RepID=A0A444VIC8_9FLAO|nr:hypothetical protein DN53_17965 [Allomuricauda olearia]